MIYYNKQLKVVETRPSALPWPPQPAEQLTCTEKLVRLQPYCAKKSLDMVTYFYYRELH